VDNLISQLKNTNSSLREAEIEGLLFLLIQSKGITNTELIQKTGLPKETLRLFLNSIGSYLEEQKGAQVKIKDEFLAKMETLKMRPYEWSLLAYNDPALTQKIREIREKFQLIPKRDYDQFFATCETSVSKYKVMMAKGVIERKKIAFLGDDDWVSLVTGIDSSKHSLIRVFDIDPGILKTIKTLSTELGIKNLFTHQYDVREALLPEFIGGFDVVVTDPPYTKSGIMLFLNRAMQLLNKEGYIFLYFGNSFKTPEKFIKIQEIIGRFGLVIEDKIDKFARYHGAESIGSASSLYVLRASEYSHDLSGAVLPKSIYTFENQKEEKFPFVDHVVFKIAGVSSDILNSKTKLQKLAGDFCKKHRLKVVDTKVTVFKGQGVSLTYILANSNLVIHTWPEYKALHIDLVTCVPIFAKAVLADTLSSLFKTNKIEMTVVE